MTTFATKTASILLAAILLSAAAARAEAIRELVTVQGDVPVRVDGFGVVTGLAKTGDKKDAALEWMRKNLSGSNQEFDASSLASTNLALVHVSAEITSHVRPGMKFPITVTSINDATDLTGGELMGCYLFTDGNRLDPFARANGPVVVGTGPKTRGTVPDGVNSGAIQIGIYPFGKIVSEEGIFRLNLNNPSFADASAIARQINQTPSLNPYLQDTAMFAEAQPFRPVAYAKDKGQVLVQIPPQHKFNVNDYIQQVLSVPVAVDRPARIVVNRARNSIVVTGDIQVNNAVVSLQDKTVTIRPETETDPAAYVLADDTPRRLVEIQGPDTYADLQGLIDTLNAMGLTTGEIITIFEELRTAGAIKAEFVGN